MRRFSSREGLHALTELNITPLLDLAFTLLIIFMITTPLMENSVDLIVPSSAAASKAVNPSDVQTVSINKAGVIKLGDQELTADQVEAELQRRFQENPQAAVVIRPHRDLSIQVFISLMDMVKRAGITKVGIMTHAEDNATPGR